MSNNVHQGHNVRRFRELRKLKQDAFARELGQDWNQQKVSLLEQKEIIDIPLLEQIARVLDMPIEAFQNLSDEQAVNVIANTFSATGTGSIQNAVQNNHECTFNPFDKWNEAVQENKELYERILKEKDDMIARLEKMMEQNK